MSRRPEEERRAQRRSAECREHPRDAAIAKCDDQEPGWTVGDTHEAVPVGTATGNQVLPSTRFATRHYQYQLRHPWELPKTNLVALEALPTLS